MNNITNAFRGFAALLLAALFTVLFLGVLFVTAFLTNCALADVVYEVESGATCTYGEDTTADTVILNNNSKIILGSTEYGSCPKNIVVHGDTFICFPSTFWAPLSVSGDGNVIYEGCDGFMINDEGIASYTGTTTIKHGSVNFAGGTFYDLTSANEGAVSYPFMSLGCFFGGLTLKIRNGSFFNGTIEVGKVLTIVKADDYVENAELKICCESSNYIQAESVFLSSGRLDVQGVIKSSLEIGEGAIFSPGNSPGTATVSKAVTLNGELLFEQDELGMDLLVADSIAVPGGENSNPTIKFDFGAEVPEGATYEIIKTTQALPWNDVEALMANVSIEGLPSNAKLSIEGNSVKVTLAADPNAVPEPSTWALLVLGAAGMLYWRKKNA